MTKEALGVPVKTPRQRSVWGLPHAEHKSGLIDQWSAVGEADTLWLPPGGGRDTADSVIGAILLTERKNSEKCLLEGTWMDLAEESTQHQGVGMDRAMGLLQVAEGWVVRDLSPPFPALTPEAYWRRALSSRMLWEALIVEGVV